ncbi:MAG TPA: ribose-phosphate pyrophosphokinase, partial [Planctomycetota bacterium]|nr:ribose-phosphate pyrophosphokinase [Planctomycetota bacterium]
MSLSEMLVFTGNAHPDLSKKICQYLGIALGDAVVGRFPDGEVSCKVLCDVRGADCFIVQPTCYPVNDNLMELVILVDCLKRASARRITAVVPDFGYARHDRNHEGRVPITSKLVANLIERAGCHRVLTIDLHAAQIQGFFDIPVDHLYAKAALVKYFEEKNIPDLVVASPDIGSSKMAWSYCKKLNGRLAMVEKRRVSPEETQVQFVIGDVEGKNVILTDDVIATGGSIAEAARVLKDKGAKDIYLCATHPVLAGNAVERLRSAAVTEIVVTDTIPVGGKVAEDPRYKVVTVSHLLGEAIRRIHNNESVSSLFQ